MPPSASKAQKKSRSRQMVCLVPVNTRLHNLVQGSYKWCSKTKKWLCVHHGRRATRCTLCKSVLCTFHAYMKSTKCAACKASAHLCKKHTVKNGCDDCAAARSKMFTAVSQPTMPVAAAAAKTWAAPVKLPKPRPLPPPRSTPRQTQCTSTRLTPAHQAGNLPPSTGQCQTQPSPATNLICPLVL